MANNSTSDVVLAIRQHSNTVNRKVVTDDEVLARANEGMWELYDLIDGAHGTYFVKPFNFSLTGGYGANTSPLPSDFYRAKGLDRSPDTSAMASVAPLPSFAERNNPVERCYDLEDVSNILIVPPTTAQGDYRLRYIPKCPQLAAPIVIGAAAPSPDGMTLNGFGITPIVNAVASAYRQDGLEWYVDLDAFGPRLTITMTAIAAMLVTDVAPTLSLWASAVEGDISGTGTLLTRLSFPLAGNAAVATGYEVQASVANPGGRLYVSATSRAGTLTGTPVSLSYFGALIQIEGSA